MSKYSICIDFDGVIHQYVSPFDEHKIPDPPVPGALDYLREMVKHFNVYILTTRARLDGYQQLISGWLAEHGLEDEVVNQLVITDNKPPALIYIDDRGYRFTGGNWPTKQEIHQFRPWNKQQ